MGDGLGGLEIPTSGDGPEAVAVGSDGPPSATRASLGSFVCALPDVCTSLSFFPTCSLKTYRLPGCLIWNDCWFILFLLVEVGCHPS